ncbi:hypothetical protein ACWCXB_21330 [Streptomyces sp. NPDC001514]
MQRHKLMTAVLVAATSLAAALVPASASVSAGSQPSENVVVIDCFSNPQVRPGEYLIACGDGNNGLTALKWSEWGRSSAKGSGLNYVNDCIPYCAAGKFHSYPVEVTLQRPEPWKKDPGQLRFTQLHIKFTTDSKPAHTPQEVTYKLWP